MDIYIEFESAIDLDIKGTSMTHWLQNTAMTFAVFLMSLLIYMPVKTITYFIRILKSAGRKEMNSKKQKIIL
jgi:hypothetical protein